MADAQALYKAGEGGLGTNEDTFIHILATHSAAYLTTVSQYYLQAFGCSLEKAIQKETSGHFENALLAVLQATCFPPRYFAQELYKSMIWVGTDDSSLIRVITTRAEIDRHYIKGEFTSMYNKTLEHMIAENYLEQLNEGFSPLIYDLVEYMGLEGKNSIRCRQVSGGEGGSSKGAAKVRCSTEKSEGKKDVHQDPSQDPPKNGSQDGFQGPPQGPSEPLSTLPLDVEEKKVLVVSIIPLWGYLSHGPGGQEIHDGHELYKATIVPVLKFMFEVDGGHSKITTTLILTCDLGEGGGPTVNPGNLGYFQDNITISLHCEMDRAATLFSCRVENVEIVKKTTRTNASSSYKWGCKGEILVPFLGIGQTAERGSSFADEISVPQLSSFYITSKCHGSSLVYNFLYPEEVQAHIADDKKGPRELITSAIGGTFEPTIVGEWDGLDQSRKCNYIFKTQRDIISIEGLRQSHGSGQEPECNKQRYELPLWVNHSMTHILHRHEIKEL